MDDTEMLEDLMKKLGVSSMEGLDKEKSIVLFGSETGNAQGLAAVFQSELKRRAIDAKCEAMDDVDVEELNKYRNIYCVISTAGQGEMPTNAVQFWKALSDPQLPTDMLANSRVAVFGLGQCSRGK